MSDSDCSTNVIETERLTKSEDEDEDDRQTRFMTSMRISCVRSIGASHFLGSSILILWAQDKYHIIGNHFVGSK